MKKYLLVMAVFCFSFAEGMDSAEQAAEQAVEQCKQLVKGYPSAMQELRNHASWLKHRGKRAYQEAMSVSKITKSIPRDILPKWTYLHQALMELTDELIDQHDLPAYVPPQSQLQIQVNNRNNAAEENLIDCSNMSDTEYMDHIRNSPEAMKQLTRQALDNGFTLDFNYVARSAGLNKCRMICMEQVMDEIKEKNQQRLVVPPTSAKQ